MPKSTLLIAFQRILKHAEISENYVSILSGTPMPSSCLKLVQTLNLFTNNSVMEVYKLLLIYMPYLQKARATGYRQIWTIYLQHSWIKKSKWGTFGGHSSI